MSKTISINPDLFSVSTRRGSRKKRDDSSSSSEIKIRAPKQKQKTVKKNHVLRFIREQQEKNYKKLLDSDKPVSELKIETNEDESFRDDFDESLNYLMSLSEQDKMATKLNSTLKNRAPVKPDSVLYYPGISDLITDQDVSMDFPSEMNNISVDSFRSPIQLSKPAYTQPTYGCLKNGTLPTWRNYNKTVRNRGINGEVNGGVNGEGYGGVNGYEIKPELGITANNALSPIVPTTEPLLTSSNESVKDYMKRARQKSEMRQRVELSEKKDQKMKYPKQKRTVRRTFKVGKSKVFPRVSVLISNKTLRNRVAEKTQSLKETPIQEVKRFLTKKGFIRVGSVAPNDVLRKMYESATLICGELENHNPDNLLYNFLNDS
jgi:hypothetical protein